MFHRLPDGIDLYYEVNGNVDSDRVLVFLNGLSQSTQAWAAIAPSFYETHKVVLIDLVFQGQSGVSENFRTYDEHAADVFHLLRENNWTGAIVCGISYGSAVAQHLLVNYPQFFSGGILLSTFAHNTALFNAIGDSWKIALQKGDYPHMLDVMLPTVLGKTYFETPLIPIQTLKEMRVTRNLSTGSLLKLMRATEVRGDYRPKLKAISVPVLVIQGEEDLLIPPSIAQEVAKHIAHSKFEIIARAGHTLNLEAIPQLNKLIREFVSVNAAAR